MLLIVKNIIHKVSSCFLNMMILFNSKTFDFKSYFEKISD